MKTFILLLIGICTTPFAMATEKLEASRSSDAGEVAASIEALGPKPATRRISNIVYSAVRKAPENVLPIVDAAVRVSPQVAVPEIVTAATAAVPDPWKSVMYQRITGRDALSASDGKQVSDGKKVIEPPQSLTLAEAIALAAFHAQPGLSLPEIRAAVNLALLSDPETLLRRIRSPQSVSGVGDAGTSNYANEPLRVRVLSRSPVPVPNPPVVSR